MVSLRVRRGETQQPERPVNTERFLIGSGPRCHLRLDGGIPSLHSLIRRDGEEIWIEALASSPPLQVNGQIRRSTLLQNGDRIEIGAFEFEVLVFERPAAAVGVPGSETQRPESGDGEKAPGEMTAEELVDEIQRQQAMVEEFETGRKMGADALMQEIIQRAAIAARTVPQALAAVQGLGLGATSHEAGQTGETSGALPAAAYAAITADFERFLEKLLEYERDLDRRAAKLAEREAQFAQAAAALSSSQEKLAEQIEQLLQLLSQAKQSDLVQQLSQLRKAV
ncbi:MAG: FHA domain-containing protein [Planctomycetes bacterium]|nr:FHA domain-containing protein [Planctomycetota bacterium]